MATPVVLTTVAVVQPDMVPSMEAEVMVAVMDRSQPEAMVAAPEAAVRSAPLVAPEATPLLGRMEGFAVEGHSDTVVVAEETDRELSLVLTLGGSRMPMRNEPLLRWGSPQDPSSVIFTLDDGVEGVERESLDNGIMAKLDALNHA